MPCNTRLLHPSSHLNSAETALTCHQETAILTFTGKSKRREIAPALQTYQMEVKTPSTAPRLVAIAPASAASHPSDTDSTKMGFNCQLCVRKKIKCDRTVPVCSGCHRSKHQCIYQAPPPRKRKRDQGHHPEDMYAPSCSVDESRVVDTNRPRPSKLLSANGKSRYVEKIGRAHV